LTASWQHNAAIPQLFHELCAWTVNVKYSKPELGIVPVVIMLGLTVLLGVLLLALFLPGEHGPAVVPYRGSNAGAYQYGDRFGKMKRQKKTLLSAKC